jgi:hypothetical protein
MKGLDAWITGANDPFAPFNQLDLDDIYSDVLAKCDWITEEIYENEYNALETAFSFVMSLETPKQVLYNNKANRNCQKDNAIELSKKIELKFQELKNA